MKHILLAHGNGGEESKTLIKEIFAKHFSNDILDRFGDSALIETTQGNIAFTTDGYTVKPIFFSGGDIGKIAVCGTCNDLSVTGAKPLYLACSFIIEEGFSISDLEKIVSSMSKEVKDIGVKIVTGDTKVVPKGSCDGIFITTSGIGRVVYDIPNRLDGDEMILLSGSIGDHGAVIFASREGIEMKSELKSDCKSIWSLVEALMESQIPIVAMRDATRGGVSAVLNEWSEESKVGILINESSINIKDEVKGISELLGIEPIELANEGTILIAIKREYKNKALEILKKFDQNSAVIGEATKEETRVIIKNRYNQSRVLYTPTGELLPRIC
jgi:hydrogenase expression/formation protein HypE